MASLNFVKYLRRFENEVFYPGVKSGVIGAIRLVNCRSVPFDTSQFSKGMGKYLPFDEVIVLDYYGYYKKSNGFRKLAEDLSTSGRQVKSMSALVVHFASIKIEDIVAITSNPYLISKFVEFKKEVLERRGFNGESNSVKQES